jgi:hypothetical protein
MSMDIIKAINSEKMFKPCFRDLSTWSSWFVLLKAIFCLPMDDADLALYRRCTGRERPPARGFKELWAVIGRRGGKSFVMAVVAVFKALFSNYSQYLSPGERGVIQVIAADRGQAQVILSYIKGILESNPVFRQYVDQSLKESIDLTNNISIEVMSCSYRSVRGRTVVCAIFDEIAFWRVEGANPDKEILGAIRPAMATIPGSLLLVISSPYARSGILFEHHRDYYGKDDPDILVWQSDTRTMNPTIDAALIERERQKDPSAARAEWDADFRDDIESFLTLDAVEACALVPGELSPDQHTVYQAFADPSGGRADAFTLGIGHLDRWTGRLTVDCVKGWQPPLNPEGVVAEITNVLRAYRVNRITGDRYAGAWVEQAFLKNGITYLPSAKAKSDLYLHFEALVNTRRVEFPKQKQLITELVNLERRRSKSGKDSIDHPPRGSDDLANSLAGVCHVLSTLEGSAFKDCDLR